MLLPTKYENLEKNILVLGADILFILKRRRYNIEELYQKIKDSKSINLDQYYNTLTFLWLIDSIELNEHLIQFKRK